MEEKYDFRRRRKSENRIRKSVGHQNNESAISASDAQVHSAEGDSEQRGRRKNESAGRRLTTSSLLLALTQRKHRAA